MIAREEHPLTDHKANAMRPRGLFQCPIGHTEMRRQLVGGDVFGQDWVPR
jgi:hypothetical protein